jgi:5-oxoprolinase (ATP-hydrolysing)
LESSFATIEALAEGALRIAVDNMANAIKRISVQRGHDVTAYTLVCFGGAGGQHACRVADALGMARVFIHPLAGVLSALGIGLAAPGTLRERSLEADLDGDGMQQLLKSSETLRGECLTALAAQGLAGESVTCDVRVHLKYAGTDTAIAVPMQEVADMHRTFQEIHRERYGFLLPQRSLVIDSVVVEARSAAGAMPAVHALTATGDGTLHRPASLRMHCEEQWQAVEVWPRERLRAGQRIDGPAVICDANATTVVEPQWQARTGADGHLLLERAQPRQRQQTATRADPVMLEIFNNLFMSIAEQMGATLANTAHSVNIKERLDFSCALFDAGGELIANAPHMPVHLGSMGASVRAVIDANRGRMRPGDTWMLNDPYAGGTHLPDITVITPVFDESGSRVLFYTGSRGHHADVGGITPGSMPPDSRHIDEEGVLISNFLLVEDGRLREAEIRALLGSTQYPARNIDQNLADLAAMVAANRKGAEELALMAQRFGLEVVQAYMSHVQDNAEAAVRRVIGRLRDGEFSYEMDHGAVIRVSVRINPEARSAVIDFSGTSAQGEDNFNAPLAVTYAAVLYVFRSLVDDDIPLNAGCLRPLQVIVPEGSLLNPRPPAAVVAGNVETSQCVTDALYGALGVMAAAQGTMNNFTFGNERHQYYETIAGGSGAGDGFDGTACVQTHMTNSRLTDPEVLEWRYPVRVDSYAIRHGSGGSGRWRGGDGGERRIRFLDTMTAAILSGHRRIPPYGMAGGLPGATGRNAVERRDGRIEALPACASTTVEPGDIFVIETPGGGGFGPLE